MKSCFAGVLGVVLAASTANGQLLISEVIEGNLPGGNPKAVELTNCGSADVDLGDYSLGSYNNGSVTLSSASTIVLTGGVLAPGDSHVFVFEDAPSADPCDDVLQDCPNFDTCVGGTCISEFEEVFGFPADQYQGFPPSVNGDDVVALFLGVATGDGSDATLVDLLGEIGVDGSNQVWEYTDSVARRNPGAGPNATFDASEWFFLGANAFDSGGNDDEKLVIILDETNLGVHDCGAVGNEVPTVSEWGLIIMTLLLLTAGTIVFGRHRATLAAC